MTRGVPGGMRARHCVMLVALGGFAVTGHVSAQRPMPDSLGISPTWRVEEYLAGRAPIALRLSRPLGAADGRLALVIGQVDVTSLLELSGTVVRYQPRSLRLPGGRSEVIAFLVSPNGAWRELGRFPLHVRNRLGLDQGRIVPRGDLSSTGQLDQGVPPGDPIPDRRTYQDLTARLGLETAVERAGWRLALEANALGVSQETQRLRWGELRRDAPVLDLSDYRLSLARGPLQLAMGHLSVGAHRHLLQGFSSRGAQAGVRLGAGARLEAAALSGSSVVGWSNLVGVTRADHRLATAALSLELAPRRPGAVQLGVTLVDGAIRPEAGFTRAAATDAERSRGAGFQLAMSDSRQRARISAGYSRSRFVNPADRLLSGDTVLVKVRPVTRDARYAELALDLVGTLLPSAAGRAGLMATIRHERVDPLYRSLGAYVRSDQQQNGVDLAGRLGPLALQGSVTDGRDNLADLRSVLTTRTSGGAANLALPLGALVGRPSLALLPTLTLAWQRTRQHGDGIPENGSFSASHVPDQRSRNQTAALQWAGQGWSLGYRWSQSFQDNRQTGRERADFLGTVHGVSVGVSPLLSLGGSAELSVERQKSIETGRTQRTERIGTSLRWQPLKHTALSGQLSHSWGWDPFGNQRTRNTESQVEWSQGFTLYHRTDGGSQGRLFLRYGRTRSAVLPASAAAPRPRLNWTLSAGSSFRLY